jgi:hypothetical protein
MHDIDRALFETQGEEYSYDGLSTYGEQGAYGEVGDEEHEELGLASDLLAITSEDELDQFLGNWINKIAHSPVGHALGGLLKDAAGKVLPYIGKAVGGYIAPGVGGAVGQQAGQWVSSRLGLEMEGMSAEDQQFETARAFVRFANDAAKAAAQAPSGVPPAVAAQQAFAAAARRHLPGLLRAQAGTPHGGRTRPPRGQWVRRGKNIIIVGV